MPNIIPFKQPPAKADDFWICGCVKRDRKGRMTHIKSNARSVAKCRKCGATRDESDRIAARIANGTSGIK